MSESQTLTIADTAARTGLSPHTLRYYERIGLVDAVERGSSGRRRYRAADVDWLEFLLRLKTTGMPIREMQRFAELRRQGTRTAGARASSVVPTFAEAPVFSERTSVGLDVHARSIVGCGFHAVTGQVFRRRLVPTAGAVLDWLRQLPGPVAVAYEADRPGFGLARQLTAAGVRCVVAAPSKLQRPAGDRVKTDARDALHLARLLRMDQIVAVRIPGENQEAARDLVRAREDTRGDLRHTAAARWLRNGVDLVTVAELLGQAVPMSVRSEVRGYGTAG